MVQQWGSTEQGLSMQIFTKFSANLKILQQLTKLLEDYGQVLAG